MEIEEMLEQTNEGLDEESIEEVEIEKDENELIDVSQKATEEQVKTLRELLKEHHEYQEELNEKIIKPRLDRKDREFQKEMSKYKRTKDLLNASFDSDNLDYINESMEAYLKENGIEVPENKGNTLSEEEYEILGNAEANKIIELGEDEIIGELDRLKNYRYEDLSSKEKYIYKRLYEKLDENKKIAELELPGYALGGLAVGESHEQMYYIIEKVVPYLPQEKPIYLMGVGTPANILEAVERGVDFFDCVYPSRNGRHGHVYTKWGKLNLFNAKYELDDMPIEEGCKCPACRTYSRGYIRHLLKAKEMLGMRLCVLHNLYFYNHLMEEIREAIEENRYASYKKEKLYGFSQGAER